MADENKKTWIKQGTVDGEYDLYGTSTSHVYLTTNNIIDNSGIYAIVDTKDGSVWDGVSTNNIRHVYVFTTKDNGTWTVTTVVDGDEQTKQGGFDAYSACDGVRLVNVRNIYISDIPCFKSKEDADNYIKTGDWSNAVNSKSLQKLKFSFYLY